ncbi:MAG: aminopeptidase [Desulfovibrio sp.]|nr:aminopeptidase [Desulfovibrio sp.]
MKKVQAHKNDDKALPYTPKNAWICNDGKDEKEMRDFTARYLAFLSACKTEREVVRYVEERLKKAGFSNSPQSDCYVTSLRGKALFAARRGTKPLKEGLSLIAAHADSPRLDLKQRPLLEQADVLQAKTHYYGGIRKYQWLSRPLALHGVISKETGETIEVCIGEEADDPVFCVADLLPHLAQKQVEQTVKEAFEGEKLNIVFGHRFVLDEKKGDDPYRDGEPKGSIKKGILALLHEKYGICEEDLITAELEVVPAGAARRVGLDQALLGGYGQDDRICVFTALEALLQGTSKGRSQAVVFWDKEEIGSDGATGASSRFLQYCIEDITQAWEPSSSPSHVLLHSWALSADVTAAIDPDFQELHEKQNAARLGFGPCFSKFTGSRGKYGSSEADAEFFARIRGVLNAKSIPWQVAELGKVDSGGGGTVALFLASYGLQVIDLGPALLAMHSPFELSSAMDVYACYQAYSAFFAHS